VTFWLRNVTCCAAQGEIDASASAQSNQIDPLDIVAVGIRALAVQIEVGRTVEAAEEWLFLRLPVDDNDNRVAGNCAALMTRATPERTPPRLMRILRPGTMVPVRTGDHVLSAGRKLYCRMPSTISDQIKACLTIGKLWLTISHDLRNCPCRSG
jgi:hypothetical protein